MTDHGWRYCRYGDAARDMHYWNIQPAGFGPIPEGGGVPLKKCPRHDIKLCDTCGKPLEEGLHNHPSVEERRVMAQDFTEPPLPKAPPLELEHASEVDTADDVGSVRPASEPQPKVEAITQESKMQTTIQGSTTKNISVVRLQHQSGRPYTTIYTSIRRLGLPTVLMKIPGHRQKLMGVSTEDAVKVLEYLGKIKHRRAGKRHKRNGAEGKTHYASEEVISKPPPEIKPVPRLDLIGPKMDQIKRVIEWVASIGFSEFHVVGSRATFKELKVTEGEVEL